MTKTLTSIKPVNTDAENRIRSLLTRTGIKYTTGINATELFENNTLLNNVYVWDYDLIPDDIVTVIHLLAQSIEQIDIDYDDPFSY